VRSSVFDTGAGEADGDGLGVALVGFLLTATVNGAVDLLISTP
jgi:hypothetical protein